MSRHRNVRSMNYNEEYETYFDVYGQSVEEDCCISPTTAAEFMYNRDGSHKEHSMSAYLDEEEKDGTGLSRDGGIPEEDSLDGLDTSATSATSLERVRADSISLIPVNLNALDRAKLRSCVEEMQNVVGETMGENTLAKFALDHNFDVEKALNAALQFSTANQGELEVKPQRVKRERNHRQQAKPSIMEEPVDPPLIPPHELQQDRPSPPPPLPLVPPREPLLIASPAEEEILDAREVIIQKPLGPPSSQLTTQDDETSVETLKNNNNLLPPEKVSRTKSRSPSPAGGESSASSRRTRGQLLNPEEAYSKERLNGKPLINLVVIGHVDAGKSTLMGHLLYSLGCVTKKVMHKNEQDSKKLGKSSFMYAWVLDETLEERNRGITMDIAQSKFETPKRNVTLLDAPGHKDFIPNMITGAAQADVAILVVDATRGEFETGFEAGGQTREHTLLVRSLGVSQLAVAINKLDNVDWSEERYKEIVLKLTSFLKQAGYKEQDIFFVPCSGLTGDNLMPMGTSSDTTDTTNTNSSSSELYSWYKGPCLVDVIDGFKAPERPVAKPFRMCIADIFKGLGAGFAVGGRIEAGLVQNGDRVWVLPVGEQATIKGITIDDVASSVAFAGDHVSLGISGVDLNKVMCGDVLCDPNKPVKVSTKFRARIVVFNNIETPITPGCPIVIHYQSMSEQATVKKLINQLHKMTGEVIKKKPRFLLKNTSGLVEIEVIRPICLELYKDNRDLGRFMLRSMGMTVAAGLVTEIL